MAGTDGISRKEYLKRYESNAEEENKKKNKKKGKKRKQRPDAPSGVLVVDEDPVWRKTVVLEEEEEGSADEDKPVVDEDIEVLRMRRLELIKARRLQNPIAEDGSGWVTLSPKRNTPPSPESGGEQLDLSPPRQRRVRRHNSSPEPNRSDSPDISPPRRRRRSSPDQAADLSPPRKGSRDVRKEGASDLSPPRSRRRLTVDGGPRGIADQDDISPPRKNGKESATLARPKTGLISGREMRDDILRTRKEDLLRFEQMDPSVSGKGAKAVYRDKKGNRISEEEYFKLNQKVEEKPKEIKIEWGKGLAQKREAESKLLELELEKEKPFARTRDDADLDTMLKERERWGDPMAHLVKKKHSEVVLPDLGDNEKMKESGFIIPQDIPSHSWIKRGLEAAPNRYGIRPGRHWDGVDRSTGFEKKMFKMKNEKQATEREAYLWSVSDM